MKRNLLLALASTAILAACSSGPPPPNQGHVTNKEDIPELTVYIPIVSRVGNSTIILIVPDTTPEHWQLQLTNDQHRSGWLQVTEQQYQRARIGQWWGGRH